MGRAVAIVEELNNLGCKVDRVDRDVFGWVVSEKLTESRRAIGALDREREGREKRNSRRSRLSGFLEVSIGISSMSEPVSESSEKVDSG